MMKMSQAERAILEGISTQRAYSTYIVLHGTGVAAETGRVHLISVARTAVSEPRLGKGELSAFPTLYGVALDTHTYSHEDTSDFSHGALSRSETGSRLYQALRNRLEGGEGSEVDLEQLYYLRLKRFETEDDALSALGGIFEAMPHELPEAVYAEHDNEFRIYAYLRFPEIGDESDFFREDNFVYQAVDAIMPYSECLFWKRTWRRETSSKVQFLPEWRPHNPEALIHSDDVMVVYARKR